MAPRVEPGSKWVLRRGDHAGQVVEVEGRTFGGQVKYRIVGRGNTQGTHDSGDDPERVHADSLEKFLALHERNYKNGDGRTHAAFRQNNRKRKHVPVEEEFAEVTRVAPKPQTNGKVQVFINKPDWVPDITVAFEFITPAMAEAWLARGEGITLNRRLNRRNVARLRTALEIGEWDVTGETIKLDKDARVRDGQHRLTAIIESGIGAWCLVVRGISESAFDKVDTGKSRNMADVMAIHGHTSTVAKSTASRGLLAIEDTGRYTTRSASGSYTSTISNARGLAYLEAHEAEIIEAVKLADKLRMQGDFIGGTGLWAIALTMFWRISPEQTEVFVDKLIVGAGLEEGSPILKLRNMYKGSARDWHASGKNRERLLANVIKAWNAWRRDELVQQISWHDSGRGAEKFPVAE